MPTYAQLQRESWWNREILTPELDWLGDELCQRTKRPRNAFGSKGDNNHLRGSHRSQEWLLKSRYATSQSYTVQPGLTGVQQRHLAGVDFTPGTVNQMVAQCKRIYAAMRAGRLEEVREFYGNVDGDKVVDGWDNVRNRAASSDSSHLWHWHLTLDRRHCADRDLMERILAIALGDEVEDDMSWGEELTLPAVDDVTYSGGKTDTKPAEVVLAGAYAYTLQVRNRQAAEFAALRTQLAGLTATVETLAQALVAGGGSVDVAAIRAHIDRRVTEAEERMRDAVADLGEGGAEQVRADASPAS